jgi:hypothetical protein
MMHLFSPRRSTRYLEIFSIAVAVALMLASLQLLAHAQGMERSVEQRNLLSDDTDRWTLHLL